MKACKIHMAGKAILPRFSAFYLIDNGMALPKVLARYIALYSFSDIGFVWFSSYFMAQKTIKPETLILCGFQRFDCFFAAMHKTSRCGQSLYL